MIHAVYKQIDGEWRTEIIRDPAVIRAYVKNRQVMEEEATLTDTLAPTGDADRDKRARKRCVCAWPVQIHLLFRIVFYIFLLFFSRNFLKTC
jgi:hypothetical protein